MNSNLVSLAVMRRISLVLGIMILALTISFGQDRTPAKAYNEGLKELKAKNYDAGLVLLEEALSLSEEGKDDKVIRLAKKNGAVAAYNIGKAKKKEGNIEEALAMYDKGIELNPDYASNFAGKAGILEEQGNMAGAVEAYLQTAAMYAEKPERAAKMEKRAQNIIGKLYTGKSYDDAIAVGGKFLELKADNAEVNYYVARANLEKGQNDVALNHADQAITLSGEEVKDKYYIAKGLALESLSRNADAVAAFKMVKGEKYKKQAEYKIQKLGS